MITRYYYAVGVIFHFRKTIGRSKKTHFYDFIGSQWFDSHLSLNEFRVIKLKTKLLAEMYENT